MANDRHGSGLESKTPPCCSQDAAKKRSPPVSRLLVAAQLRCVAQKPRAASDYFPSRMVVLRFAVTSDRRSMLPLSSALLLQPVPPCSGFRWQRQFAHSPLPSTPRALNEA